MHIDKTKFSANIVQIFDITKHLIDFFDFFMTINDRVVAIIEHENLTVASFARKLDIGDQTVRSVCVLRRNRPSFEFLSKMIQTFEWLNPKWLLTGEGEMVISNSDESDCSELKAISRNLSELIRYIREKDDQIIRGKDEKIEQLVRESTEWRIKYEMTVNRKA